MVVPIVSLLADSRAFDTYYLNPRYRDTGYGYNQTFAFLLRRRLLQARPQQADFCHIPDHFRGGTVQNNIIRLALTDPDVVVLLDGIWETLLNKEHFHQWVAQRIDRHEWKSGKALDLNFSSKRLADLYINGELTASPEAYAARIADIVGYFRRRGRNCIWLTTPQTPANHLEGRHFAGNYLTFPDWGRCIAALNEAVAEKVRALGGHVIDLDRMMAASGGASACLIDQWHFSASFHAQIAEGLGDALDRLLKKPVPPPDHISRAFMLNRPPGQVELALVGRDDVVAAWRSAHEDARIVHVTEAPSSAIGTAPLILVLEDDRGARQSMVQDLLKGIEPDQMIAFASEIEPIENPAGKENHR